MQHHSLVLVLPDHLIQQYQISLRDRFIPLEGFIGIVAATQPRKETSP
jgi:hypothetical protein